MKNLFKILLINVFIFIFFKATDAISADSSDLTFHPISHATFVIKSKAGTIYIDPVGEVSAFQKFPKPDLILITDIHGDHLNIPVINSLKQKSTTIVGPKAVIEQLKFGDILKNGEVKTFGKIKLEAIPMYNTTLDRLKFHVKGRGNGYIVTIGGKRIYISGDTEDIKEMRDLKNIDFAFVCMNLPYTMTVEKAASAVLAFRPKVVFPYHFRGKKDGKRVFSDVKKFKSLVGKNAKIEVRIQEWYE